MQVAWISPVLSNCTNPFIKGMFFSSPFGLAACVFGYGLIRSKVANQVLVLNQTLKQQPWIHLGFASVSSSPFARHNSPFCQEVFLGDPLLSRGETHEKTAKLGPKAASGINSEINCEINWNHAHVDQ